MLKRKNPTQSKGNGSKIVCTYTCGAPSLFGTPAAGMQYVPPQCTTNQLPQWMKTLPYAMNQILDRKNDQKKNNGKYMVQQQKNETGQNSAQQGSTCQCKCGRQGNSSQQESTVQCKCGRQGISSQQESTYPYKCGRLGNSCQRQPNAQCKCGVGSGYPTLQPTGRCKCSRLDDSFQGQPTGRCKCSRPDDSFQGQPTGRCKCTRMGDRSQREPTGRCKCKRIEESSEPEPEICRCCECNGIKEKGSPDSRSSRNSRDSQRSILKDESAQTNISYHPSAVVEEKSPEITSPILKETTIEDDKLEVTSIMITEIESDLEESEVIKKGGNETEIKGNFMSQRQFGRTEVVEEVGSYDAELSRNKREAVENEWKQGPIPPPKNKGQTLILEESELSVPVDKSKLKVKARKNDDELNSVNSMEPIQTKSKPNNKLSDLKDNGEIEMSTRTTHKYRKEIEEVNPDVTTVEPIQTQSKPNNKLLDLKDNGQIEMSTRTTHKYRKEIEEVNPDVTTVKPTQAQSKPKNKLSDFKDNGGIDMSRRTKQKNTKEIEEDNPDVTTERRAPKRVEEQRSDGGKVFPSNENYKNIKNNNANDNKKKRLSNEDNGSKSKPRSKKKELGSDIKIRNSIELYSSHSLVPASEEQKNVKREYEKGGLEKPEKNRSPTESDGSKKSTRNIPQTSEESNTSSRSPKRNSSDGKTTSRRSSSDNELIKLRKEDSAPEKNTRKIINENESLEQEEEPTTLKQTQGDSISNSQQEIDNNSRNFSEKSEDPEPELEEDKLSREDSAHESISQNKSIDSHENTANEESDADFTDTGKEQLSQLDDEEEMEKRDGIDGNSIDYSGDEDERAIRHHLKHHTVVTEKTIVGNKKIDKYISESDAIESINSKKQSNKDDKKTASKFEESQDSDADHDQQPEGDADEPEVDGDKQPEVDGDKQAEVDSDKQPKEDVGNITENDSKTEDPKSDRKTKPLDPEERKNKIKRYPSKAARKDFWNYSHVPACNCACGGCYYPYACSPLFMCGCQGCGCQGCGVPCCPPFGLPCLPPYCYDPYSLFGCRCGQCNGCNNPR